MKHLDIILHEMARRVGANWDDIDGKQDGWYSLYEWTEEEQDNFKTWLVNYLYESSEARKELLQFPSIYKSKKRLTKVADWFLLQYGWKFKEKEYANMVG